MHSIGFSNYTGRGVTQDQINVFCGFVSSAAALYDSDIQKHLSFIVSQMNTYVGN
jgi:hypothetical protein